ncbi:hypothetical protein J2Y45_001585 [Dyadobacter sp. BE34]|uniref:Lipoprotein n=1 Tax=Dyadobacter fermentans TaxID=94254 RepID=A0ABU1QT42_9BACT|nr:MULTISPECIES: hypothetical protein [Dyadobacter]MDR6804316.1 hypothetical protein [Dyadobacter fermentans]MDR7042056.1 hypothetical protein [Dyadobacter sp. BE242]MDR7196459.1 hypothetical protein [Dyadobacter sp. BE34]MDR7212996.1 hypothetical protein [Dyadobacter sp. BE31]MDR7261865.1 hypothetical protein [Dyadobacter sp. BE32]
MKTHFKIQCGVFKRWLLLPMMALAMLACGHLGDRTTVVYGKVFDENQVPVDSILVLLSGSRLKGSIDLKSTYTDENGDYEIALEVPRKFGDINVGIPYGDDNPKFEKIYRQATDIKGQRRPMIGKKTQCDFQLEPK